jgi:hypothetical protein
MPEQKMFKYQLDYLRKRVEHITEVQATAIRNKYPGRYEMDKTEFPHDVEIAKLIAKGELDTTKHTAQSWLTARNKSNYASQRNMSYLSWVTGTFQEVHKTRQREEAIAKVNEDSKFKAINQLHADSAELLDELVLGSVDEAMATIQAFAKKVY